MSARVSPWLFALPIPPLAYYYYQRRPLHAAVRATNLNRKRIVAVGDLHGDYAQAIRTLKLLKIIDKDENWSGGNNTTFVQTVSYRRATNSEGYLDVGTYSDRCILNFHEKITLRAGCYSRYHLKKLCN